MEEIWKKIDGHPNYSVSNLGRIKNDKKNKLIKPVDNGYGYVQVELNGIKYRVHRLVAKAFIPNPKGLPIVNHKDEVKNNNICENLEWCDVPYNNKYSSHKQIQATAKKILQLDKNGNIIKEWESISEASRVLNIPRHVIHGCCNNNSGFDFKYK